MQSRHTVRSTRPVVGALLALVVLGGGVAVGWSLAGPWRLAGRVAEQRPSEPSRLYARPEQLRLGERSAAVEVEALLSASGYARRSAPDPVRSGSYQRLADGLAIGRREVPRPDGAAPLRSAIVEIRWREGRVSELTVDGRAVDQVALEPVLLASIYGEDLVEHRPLRWDRLPEHVPEAFLAAEDDRFRDHLGLSIPGIVRAVWANLRAGRVVQGGSTITQQVARTLFLRQERRWGRKLREAVLAPLIELRNSKETILRAYLDHLYLGSRDGVSLVGVGAASRAFFGKDAADLTVAEAALLAGIVPSPGRFDPIEHPEEALRRRNRVLGRLGELGWEDAAALRAARDEPVSVTARRPRERRAPHFVGHVVGKLERTEVGELAGKGFTVFTTLAARDQQLAERAVREGMAELQDALPPLQGEEEPLEAALVSMEPSSGEILAWVGGRDWERSHFDRVAQARRQAGSAFKPIVYAAALARGRVGPQELVADAPLVVEAGGRQWRPDNIDGRFRGPVTVRRALESSLNVPTVRVALHTGLTAVVDTARELGIESPLEPVPSLALGAFEVSPLELCRVYATLAAGGHRPEPRSVLAVTGRDGVPVVGREPGAPVKALDPVAHFQLTWMLRGVVDRGTAAGVRRLGVTGPIAGKTGTSDGGRDSWFAGFTPGRATVVWVGADEPRPTTLTGSRGALPLWVRFQGALGPEEGGSWFEMPGELEWFALDAETGLLATDLCPDAVAEPLRPWEAPPELCPLGHLSRWPELRSRTCGPCAGRR